MPTSVHLTPDLLAWLEAEAMRQGVTRSRLIAMILTREMRARDDWSFNLFPTLIDSAMAEKKAEKKK